MNRRQALKNIGMGAGILVVGPTTLSLLQSCKNDPQVGWEPVFLSVSNAYALKQILEVILPATDTPGANDLNIAGFIDSYMDEVASEDRRGNFNRGAEAFSASFKDLYNKDPEKGNEEEYLQIVDKYLKATPEQREEYIRRNTETQDPLDKDPEDTMDFDSGAYSYLQDVRDLGIWAWKTSEEIGENVLWYDPNPGMYIACGPVNELGNGKTMSL